MKGKTMIVIGLLLLASNAATAAFIASRMPAPVSGNPALGGSGVPTAKRQPPSPQIQIIIAALTSNSQGWLELAAGDKIASLEAMIGLFRERENAAILKSPEEYVAKIDSMVSSDSSMKALNLPTLIKIAAVMEYDFYNGQDKETLAQQVLGPQLYQQNKARLSRP